VSFKKDLKNFEVTAIDKIKKGKKQEKKIITFKPSNKDSMPDIAIKLDPERRKPMKEIVIITICFMVLVFIIWEFISDKNNLFKFVIYVKKY
jgi:hypothetical protein